jgi:glycosyltransferase involved in cell wall biosynthesis
MKSTESMPTDNQERRTRSVSLSAVMIAKNAEATIEKALKSVRFCDEIIVVVDSSSTDTTESIARRLANHVEVRDWEGFGPAKRAVVSLAKGRWIFSIDADEEVTHDLASSICDTLVSDTPSSVAYRIKRRTRFLGRWMLHGDWGRDRVVRLFQKEKAQFTDDPVHESVSAPDTKPILHGWLLHEGDQDISSYLIRLDRYTTLAAELLHSSGRRSGYLSIIVRPLFKFLQVYFIRLGLLDGWQGLVLAWYSAVYVFTKYAKLRDLNRRPD